MLQPFSSGSQAAKNSFVGLFSAELMAIEGFVITLIAIHREKVHTGVLASNTAGVIVVVISNTCSILLHET